MHKLAYKFNLEKYVNNVALFSFGEDAFDLLSYVSYYFIKIYSFISFNIF